MKKTNQLFIYSLAFACLVLMLASGCKKKESIKDCITNNYGVVHFNFASTANPYSISASTVGVPASRTKEIAMGVASDTMHMAPGTWTITILKLDSPGGVGIAWTTETAITSQCSDEWFTITL